MAVGLTYWSIPSKMSQWFTLGLLEYILTPQKLQFLIFCIFNRPYRQCRSQGLPGWASQNEEEN